MTSSCTSANVCSSSSAAAASTTTGSSSSPPLPTNAQWQNAGRSRLPPATTRFRNSSRGSTSTTSTSRPAIDLAVEETEDPRLDRRGDPRERRRERRFAPIHRRRLATRRRVPRFALGSLRRVPKRDQPKRDPVAFLSDDWLAALDARARNDRSGPDVEMFVLEQVVTDVPDRGEVRYRVTFSADGVRVAPMATTAPDVTFGTDHATAVAISRGETNAQRALAAGRFSVRGNVEALVSRGSALAALDDVFAEVRAGTTYP